MVIADALRVRRLTHSAELPPTRLSTIHIEDDEAAALSEMLRYGLSIHRGHGNLHKSFCAIACAAFLCRHSARYPRIAQYGPLAL
jgi:hypothetical protein